ncbi:class I SAM-dependent methyltransferase [Burkholderia cenocepacia]|uniref:class I SAM-dependent methyltransferase n=1 Tax=Burkholderia TaxID=32008 RepID=UPI00075329FB|nr:MULTISPECIES: class I SAM-dependent methyltransferase [Burkholderia]ARF89745.1 methyltransferase [Burkholderia cenocepacia]KWF26294.1 methyltransferase type 12 [Burkholderia cenocepacia]MBJ9693378.1 class I SAM-dependent methyltransferase [Burkholderia cenocepacia]MBN3532030.1 class I SAM-dependent methyltransferase [Burkholderia cenocepacia]MBR7904902.1 class I SAM-dependent methyltransferase [Burkholderia cenocepacia]
MKKALHELNRLSWNTATVAHNSHKGDQAAFFRNGGSTLFPEERELLGDLTGLRLLHLQCNAGQDTLSLVRDGADATGVDISDEAIDFARRLSADAGLPARFERADVLDWMPEAAARGERFDRVFTSYGAICWLSDLSAWARGIASLLAPGGRFAMIEFHPFSLYFDEQWQPRYDYFKSDATEEPAGVGDYVAASGTGLGEQHDHPGIVGFANPHPSYEFMWGIGDVVNALVSAGLAIERLNEYPYANGWKGFDGMRELEGRRMVPPEGMPRLPLMYAIAAQRAAA